MPLHQNKNWQWVSKGLMNVNILTTRLHTLQINLSWLSTAHTVYAVSASVIRSQCAALYRQLPPQQARRVTELKAARNSLPVCAS